MVDTAGLTKNDAARLITAAKRVLLARFWPPMSPFIAVAVPPQIAMSAATALER